MKPKANIIALGAIAALSTTALAGPTMVTPKQQLDIPIVVEIDDGLGFTLSTGYDSDYMFRGVRIGQNSVWAALDWNRDVTDMVALNLGAWAESLANDNYNELDLYGGVTFNFTPEASLTIGGIGYIYGDSDAVDFGPIDDSFELFGSLGYQFNAVALELYYGYDFDVEGGYGAFTTGYSYDVNDMLAIAVSAGISISHDYNFSGSDWNNIDLRLAIPIALTDRATLEPYIAGSIALSGIDDYEDDRFYGGVALAVTF